MAAETSFLRIASNWIWYAMYLANDCGMSPVRSDARTVAMYTGGKCCAMPASTSEKLRPSRRARKTSAKTARTPWLRSLASKVPMASVRFSPASSKASSSWLNDSSGKLPATAVPSTGSAPATPASIATTPKPPPPPPRNPRPPPPPPPPPPSKPTTHRRRRSDAPWMSVISAVRNIFPVTITPDLPVLAQGGQVKIPLLPRRSIDIRPTPGVHRRRILQIGAAPLGLVCGLHDQGFEPLLCARVMTVVEPVSVQRLAQAFDLGLGGIALGLAQLREIARTHVSRQQTDDDDHHQQFQQRKAPMAARPGRHRVGVGALCQGRTTTFHLLPYPRPMPGPRICTGEGLRIRSTNVSSVLTVSPSATARKTSPPSSAGRWRGSRCKVAVTPPTAAPVFVSSALNAYSQVLASTLRALTSLMPQICRSGWVAESRKPKSPILMMPAGRPDKPMKSGSIDCAAPKTTW